MTTTIVLSGPPVNTGESTPDFDQPIDTLLSTGFIAFRRYSVRNEFFTDNALTLTSPAYAGQGENGQQGVLPVVVGEYTEL